MISHIAHKTRDLGPHCTGCQIHQVRFHGALCFVCREDARDRKAMGAIVLICLCAALLAIGFISAYGQWSRMN
jgi:hypothetical protein